MNKRPWAFAALLSAALLVASELTAEAADLRNMLADYSISSWTQKDGLPPGTIRALAQDVDGFLWLGGDFGLARFDGARFVQWSALRTSPNAQRPVQTLYVSRDGSLWVGFAGQGGISRIKDSQITTFGTTEGLTAGPVTSIVEDREGDIVAVSGGGLFHWRHAHWDKWNVRYGPASGQVRTAYVGPSGDFFLVADVGIFRRRKGDEAFQQLENNDAESRAQDIVEDRAGRAWVTDVTHGLRRLNERQARSQPPGDGKGYRLLTDELGNLWVATLGQGLWRVRMDARTRYAAMEQATDLTGLSNNSPFALLEDRDGNIWAGTSAGLNRLTAHKITGVAHLGLATGLDITRDGHVWVGTADGVIRLAEHGGTWQRDAQYFRGSETRAMHVDANGTVWLATEGGLFQIVNGSSRRVPDDVAGGLQRISALTSDSSGAVWLYDTDRGLVRWKKGHVDPVALPPEIQHTRVSTMYTDRTGRTWIGFVQGHVGVVDPDGTIRSYGPNDGLPGGFYRAFYEDETGTVWIAGNLGLSRFSNGRFVTLRDASGALANLTSVIGDDAGALWLGNASGIVRMNRSEFDRGIISRSDQLNYRLLGTSDGVAGTTGWTGQRSAIRTTDGRLWFLTGQGLTIVDPRAQSARHAPERVQIDAAFADDRKLEPASQVRLAAGTTRIEINYTAPDLTSTLKTRFRYRLDGFDTDWVEAGLRRQAIYANLPGRTYLFRVQASNEDGLWVRQSATWAFSIQPRFYETRWFYALLAVFCVIMAGTMWQLRAAQMRRRFAVLINERVRLSREIHDTLLQSLVGVALQLDHMENTLEPPATRRHLTRMRQQVEEYIREARRSIWDLRSTTLQRGDLATALRHAGDRAVESDVAFDLRVVGTPRRCVPAVEEQVLRIGQEAVANAIRHSQANRIDVELQYDDETLTLRVLDDGCGFESTWMNGDGNGHWGVTSMKERTETVGGAFRISSAARKGTLVEAVVPTPAAGSAS